MFPLKIFLKVRGVCRSITVFFKNVRVRSTTNKNEILPLVTTWMDLEGIMLGKIHQTKMLYVITYMWNLKKKKKSNK